MTPERWRQISGVFHDALARDAEAREPFLDEVCAGDETLRAEVIALLEAHHNAGQFGERPVVELLHDAADVGADLGTSDTESVPGIAEPGMTLGSYRIERSLGRGGMGVVYLAYDTTLHRQVALKVLGAPAAGGTARARLLREARNAAALNHPAICTVYEVGEADGCAFIAMEYVDGRPLSDRLAGSALPLEEAVQLRHRGRRRAWLRARPRRHSPRLEGGQCDGHDDRPVEARRFRSGPARRRAAGRRHDDGIVGAGRYRRRHALLDGAGTSPRRRHGCSHRHLGAGCAAV